VVRQPGAPWDARELVRSCGLAAWKFDNLIPGQAPFKPYLSRTEAAPIIDVTDGFAAYYAKVHVKAHQFCRELERKSRKLSREAGEVHMVADTDANPLSQLTNWKSSQYRRSNRFDKFGQPWLRELLEELLVTDTPHLSGLVTTVYAGTERVSIQFGLRAGSVCEGTVYTRTPLGVARLAGAAGRQHALDPLRGHPGMRRTSGRVLRRTGLTSRLRDRI
jgi:hypothetical protein